MSWRPVAVGLAAYVQVFLLGVQTKNLQHNAILLTGLVSVGISCMWLISVTGVVKSVPARVAYVIGAALGAMSAIPFYAWINGG